VCDVTHITCYTYIDAVTQQSVLAPSESGVESVFCVDRNPVKGKVKYTFISPVHVRKAYGGRAVLLPSFIALASDVPAAFGTEKRAGVALGPGLDITENSGTSFPVGNRAVSLGFAGRCTN
jgi:hypothetical protein